MEGGEGGETRVVIRSMQDHAASICSHNSSFSVLLRNSVLMMRFTVMTVNQRTTAQSAGEGRGRRGMGVVGGSEASLPWDSPTMRRKKPRAAQNASSLNDRLLKFGVKRPCRGRGGGRGGEGRGRFADSNNSTCCPVHTYQHVDNG